MDVDGRDAADRGDAIVLGCAGSALAPTLDTRAVLRDVITGVFDLSRKQADTVFPDTGGLRIPGNLMR